MHETRPSPHFAQTLIIKQIGCISCKSADAKRPKERERGRKRERERDRERGEKRGRERERGGEER